jgi:hypothetical protein
VRGWWGEGGGGVGKGRDRGKRGEMTQTLYAHMNKKLKKKPLFTNDLPAWEPHFYLLGCPVEEVTEVP